MLVVAWLVWRRNRGLSEGGEAMPRVATRRLERAHSRPPGGLPRPRQTPTSDSTMTSHLIDRFATRADEHAALASSSSPPLGTTSAGNLSQPSTSSTSRPGTPDPSCAFCAIVAGEEPAHLVRSSLSRCLISLATTADPTHPHMLAGIRRRARRRLLGCAHLLVLVEPAPLAAMC